MLQESNAKVKQMNDCTNTLTGQISNLADQRDVLEVCCVLELELCDLTTLLVLFRAMLITFIWCC